MFKRFRLMLGPGRVQALFFLLALTGLGSILLNVAGAEETAADWVAPAQNVLVGVFVVGSVIIIGSALPAYERGRWLGILAPAAGLVLLGLFFFPNQVILLMGGAVGWVLAGMFLFKARGPMEYQQAIKAFRKNEYQEAVDTITKLIRQEPKVAAHYRLRAEFFRVWGKLDRARKDYKKVVDLVDDDSIEKWVGYNGMAEVEIQMNQLDNARHSASKALELAPDQWVIAFNLGMIEDRSDNPQAALDHLQTALENRIPEAHYRFLTHFYRARSYARLGDLDAAAEAAKQLKTLGGGLNQWQMILQSDQADTLRDVLEDDINTAGALFGGEITPADLLTHTPNIPVKTP